MTIKKEIIRKQMILDLSNIDKFLAADFERKKYPAHKNRIMKSIIENGLLKNDVHVWVNNKKYMVIDGQHRIGAMKELLNDGFKGGFAINLNIIPANNGIEARKIYHEINMNVKSLVNKDIVKEFDDGNHPFFDKLRRYCTHYGDKKTVPFTNVIAAMKYADTGINRMLRDEYEEWMENESQPVDRAVTLLEKLDLIVGLDTRQFIYKAPIFRNLFRIYWLYFLDGQGKFETFIRRVNDCKFLKDNCGAMTLEGMNSLYRYMEDMLNKLGVEKKENKT